MDEEKAESQPENGPEWTMSFRDKLAEARKNLEELPEDSPTRRYSEKWLKYFDSERDNTGALKRKFFGLEMQSLLSRKEMIGDLEKMKREMFGGPEIQPLPRLKFDEDGGITIPEGENQSYVFMNMGELDRFNKEGGSHEAGDKALQKAEEMFEISVHESLRDAGVEDMQDAYSIFRFSGNDFVVSIRETAGDGEKPEGERLKDVIVRKLMERGPTIEGVKEPAPIVATGMELKDAVGLFHGLQTEMEPGKRITDPDQAARELFGLLATHADHALDVMKFESRVGRVLGKLDEAGGDAAKVRPFFESYMKKMFTDTELEEIDDFAALDRGRIPEMALDYARRNLGKATDFEVVQSDAIGRELDQVRASDVVSARLREMRRPAVAERFGPFRHQVELAVIPARTEGQVVLDRLMKDFKAAPKGESEEDIRARETAGLDYMSEFARRDQGTGLLERGVHYEDLEKDIEEGKDVSVLFIDMGFLKYFDKGGGRDVGNNALKFAADLMERAARESGAEASVYRYAGDEFTVRLVGGEEQADAFRVALDRLSHGKSGTRLAIPPGKLGSEGGYYPTELVFNDGFADRKMAERVFADMERAGAFTDEDLENGKFVNNKKAELMTVLADKRVIDKKAVSRFELLIGRMRDPRFARVQTQLDSLIGLREQGLQERLAAGEHLSAEELRVKPESLLDQVEADEETKDFWEQTGQMAVYSGKAIFAEDGGANLLRAWAESGRPIVELRDEIDTFVEQCIEEAEGADKESRDLRDRLVEVHIRADYYERKVWDMEERLLKAGGENRALKDEIGVLQEMLAKAKEERTQLVEGRRVVDEAA